LNKGERIHGKAIRGGGKRGPTNYKIREKLHPIRAGGERDVELGVEWGMDLQTSVVRLKSGMFPENGNRPSELRASEPRGELNGMKQGNQRGTVLNQKKKQKKQKKKRWIVETWEKGVGYNSTVIDLKGGSIEDGCGNVT